MVQPSTSGYLLDPNDPRAPTVAQWETMTAAERTRAVESLPLNLPLEVQPPEGDAHRIVKQSALSALDDFLRRSGRRIYVSSELIVLYPGERPFVPDLMAVLDVEPHERMRWVTSVEGKGLDLVIEVHVSGDRRKDEQLNVERYARLGIREYFLFDRPRASLRGHRLARGRAYERMLPQGGHFASEVLGLDLSVENGRLRFFAGNAPLEEAAERIARLGAMLDDVIAHQETMARDAEDARRDADVARHEVEQAKGEAEQAKHEVSTLAAKLAAAEAELAQLRARR